MIMKDINYFGYNTVKKVVIDVKKALDRGVSYDSSRKEYKNKDCQQYDNSLIGV